MKSWPTFRIAGRVLVNLASLNASGAVGNYTALQRAHIVYRKSDGSTDITETPGIITGNMVKHWHAKLMTLIYQEEGGTRLCEFCKRGVMYRTANLGNGVANSEADAVQKCAIHDVHGFLAAEERNQPPIRRESTVKFAFMLPAEEAVESISSDPITHNRVVVSEKGKIERKGGMMIFKREYTSAIYGFLASFEAYAVGRTWARAFSNNGFDVEDEERKRRIKAALEAFAHLLMGDFGAARARAFPAIKPLEVIAVASRRIAPNLVHGFYRDWKRLSLEMIKSWASNYKDEVLVLTYNIDKELVEDLKKVGVKVEEVNNMFSIARRAYGFLTGMEG
jgi:CRISPR-associated protein Cst2